MKSAFSHSKSTGVIFILMALLVIGAGYEGYRIYVLSKDLKETKTSLEASMQNARRLQNEKQDLEYNLVDTQDQKTKLENDLRKEKKKNGSLSDKVTTLTKLTTIDPELLKKYSKVYFLNENYVPTGLEDIPVKYASVQKTLQFHEEAFPYLKELLEDAEKDAIPLKVVSAYRSFGEQSALKSTYVFTYGAGSANSFSADQGYSEHQLGTALDFTTPTLVGAVPAFDQSSSYTWLKENAYKYGFILSYPKGNAYYIYEPWHWRFVGVELATKLHEDNMNFYDMNQRDIDEYLIKLFD